MAGDWIKVKTDLATDPAVIRTASTLGLAEDMVVGKLCRLWSWANTHTEDGHATGVTLEWLDWFLNCDDFGTALVDVGWLDVTDDGVMIPRFERHNGKSAKTRATARERKRRQRGGDAGKSAPDAETQRAATESNGHAGGVTQPGHTFDREEKRREELPPPLSPPPETANPCPADFTPCPSAWAGVIAEMVELGIFAPQPVVDAARNAGSTPEEIEAVLAHARRHAGAFTPLEIRGRVMVNKPGQASGEGWPPPGEDYQRAREVFLDGEKKQEREAKRADEELRRAEDKQADDDREQRWGPLLDGMTHVVRDRLAVDALGGSGPALSRFRLYGATGIVRKRLLDHLDDGGLGT